VKQNNPQDYKEGDRVKIYRKGANGVLLCDITLKEAFCKRAFDRMLFFKYDIPPGDYRAVKVKNNG